MRRIQPGAGEGQVRGSRTQELDQYGELRLGRKAGCFANIPPPC